MLRYILAPVAALSMLVGGCNSTSGGLSVADVQAALKNVCGFEMLAGTVASTIAALLGIPGISTAIDIANAVCAKVNETTASGVKAAPDGTIVVVVRGVVVQGHRIR